MTRLRAVIAAATLVLPLVARADDRSAAAREHYRRGQEALAAKKYDQAIEQFLAAAALAPQPLLWFNVAQVYLAKGDERMALQYFQRYLAAEPAGAAAEIARARVEELTPRVATARSTPLAAAPARPPRPRAGQGLRIAGLATAGVGLGLAGLGGYFGLEARAKSAAIEDLFAANGGAWDVRIPGLTDAGEQAERRMWIVYGAAGAMIVGGAVTYWLGARRRADTDTTTTVVLAPSGVAIAGRF